MKNNLKNLATSALFILSMVAMPTNVVAQDKKMEWTEDTSSSSIVMTWNKDTPESEMNSDIKALKEHGVDIKYSNIKRNNANEITAIKVSFNDNKGNKGDLNLEYKNPIPTITFFKNQDQVGFGQSENSNPFEINDLSTNGIIKQFRFEDLDPKSESFHFSFPETKRMLGSTKSKIIIKNPNKKQLVIEDGKVIEGGDDYSAEELEKIKSEHTIELQNSEEMNPTTIQGFYDLRDDEGMKNFKNQFQNLLPKSESVDEINAAKEEIIKAKEELIKAREELQKANQSSNKATIQKKK
ncbi:MAG: hypothetical protein RLZZ231_1371 [Bacteroidota bacterium]